jgi:hypothetical protein
MLKPIALATSMVCTLPTVAAALVLTALPNGADATSDRGTTAHFRGPVVVGGRCVGKAAYRGSLRQSGDRVVATFHVRRAGPHHRWGLATDATTEYGDGSTVTGIGHGYTRADATGRLTMTAATPVGWRHDFKFYLTRPETNEFCFVRVRA